jgi:sigma-B regulation protein RsbU (phosphoserine phosphatase)
MEPDPPQLTAPSRLVDLNGSLQPTRVPVDPEASLRTLCRLLVPAVADACEVSVLEGDRFRRVVVPGETPAEYVAAREATVTRLGDRHPIAKVARDGVPHFARIEDDDADVWFGPPGMPHTARAIGLHQVVLLPLVARSGVVGVLGVGLGVSGRSFADTDLELLQVAATQAAAALENGQLYDAARRTVATLQRALLPSRLPSAHWFRAVGRYQPASSDLEVGGDWYDAALLPDGALAVTIGDVGGHGVAAAAVMGQLRSAIAALHLDHATPDAVVRRLERLAILEDGFATVLCGTVDRHGRFRWTSAGHPPPLLVRRDGSVELLATDPAPPLGAGHLVRPVVHEHQLADGDVVVLYTDGLIERRDEHLADAFDRLLAVAATAAGGDLAGVVDLFLRELPAGTDDVAVLAIGLDIE